MARTGNRYPAGCLLERRQQYATHHGMRCARRSPGNIHTVCYGPTSNVMTGNNIMQVSGERVPGVKIRKRPGGKRRAI
ncbi:hypothetical protein Y032_0017g3424 [Ancylostoma ceylanicum]|uniref:Uncharacterized protein n=1 Tax=Ancylostoma ceylanicum TaxID=53326 RepID=A0A016V568_9BILA|nr:hypothetical protein Y032_0017g3424 [Ancylostoma ceylanicum]